jgi:hypothetical protein
MSHYRWIAFLLSQKLNGQSIDIRVALSLVNARFMENNLSPANWRQPPQLTEEGVD